MNTDNIITPFKYNKPILKASGEGFDSVAVDCPMPFFHNGRYYMTYVGFDGRGYQTGLAVSDDLINWEKLGCILKRGSNAEWDKVGQAGAWILQDVDMYGKRQLKKVNGKYVMIYHSYPDEGYEAGPASMGIAFTDDETLMTWECKKEPIFVYDKSIKWEGGGLYKCCFLENDGKYYMYYNAKNDSDFPWTEQTGLAVSTDLYHWERYENNPVLPVSEGKWDSLFASDPSVLYDSKNDRWLMFYFGFDGNHAMEGIAYSNDLINWEKHPEPIIKNDSPIDGLHAHKPGIIVKDGVLYHYYCAVDKDDNRCIALAASENIF
jgi:predicted GH43/DUF377 family glycosyl hydrolase